jgi:murein DD-endopeptidase MepM/ murein hydrolase activator NlpD
MMTSVHGYKRLENKLVQKVKNAAVIAAGFILKILKSIGKFLTRRYTVVFVPHSEKKVYNLHLTILSFLCFVLVVSGIIGVFYWYGVSDNSARYAMTSRDGRLRDTQASLDQLRDEAALLFREARNFETTLSKVLADLGINAGSTMPQNTSGDLSSFLGIKETSEGMLREVDELRVIAAYLSQIKGPITEIGALLDAQNILLTEIPSIWPVRNRVGRITMFFGQNIHPFTRQYYIHTGIDIATNRYGDPVVSTADGQVVAVEFDTGYGNYIIIRHKHGYYTRYAHLQSSIARIGQRVQQGEVIGYIGNTGISTGPHLHYEVHIGSDVVDPYRYINIRSSMVR